MNKGKNIQGNEPELKAMKNGFLGIDAGVNFETSLNEARVVIIPFGMEMNVSYGGGTRNGPKAIIEASHEVETLDEEVAAMLESNDRAGEILTSGRGLAYKCGICTLRPPAMPSNPQEAIDLLAGIVSQVADLGKFPLVLGGEHTLTQGSLKGILSNYSDITILQFDAHSDTRESYDGTEYSHASVMNQCLTKLPISNLVQVGIRNVSDTNNEIAFRRSNRHRIKTFWAWEDFTPKDVVEAIKTENVFVTFDVDGLGFETALATGTPEPGGLGWWRALNILKAVFRERNVVGSDVVELAPTKGLYAYNYSAARLVYKMIGYKFPTV